MKVLYISFSCSPYRGSECMIGWQWPFCMKEYHDIYVLTRSEFKSEIEDYLDKNNIKGMHFFYYDIPTNVARISRKIWVVYYKIWLLKVEKYLMNLVDEYKFDIVHHVTMNEFRTIDKVWKINSKYIFGPIGGGQLTPKYLKRYTKGHGYEEKVREFLNRTVVLLPKYRKAINACSYVFSANIETKEVVDNVIENRKKTKLLLDIGMDSKTLYRSHSITNREYDIMTFIWAGRMVYRKGLELLIDALSTIPNNYPYKVILCGDGPQRKSLETKVQRLNLSDKVFFVGSIPYQNMQEYYLNADAFIFPSLRETAGTVLLEAMSFKLPVIGFKNGGLRSIIDESNGYFINGSSIEAIIQSISKIIIECVKNPELVKKKGNMAYKLVLNNYTWDKKAEYMNQVYLSLFKENEE